MRRLQWRVLLGLTLLAAIGFAVFLWTLPRHRINRQSYDDIASGMTENQVCKVLSAPPAQVAKGERERAIRSMVADGDARPELTCKEWSSRDCIIMVAFEKGVVCSKAFVPLRQPATILDKIREFIGI
jgi:hypothetical protein